MLKVSSPPDKQYTWRAASQRSYWKIKQSFRDTILFFKVKLLLRLTRHGLPLFFRLRKRQVIHHLLNALVGVAQIGKFYELYEDDAQVLQHHTGTARHFVMPASSGFDCGS